MPRTQALHGPQETTPSGHHEPAFYNVLGSRISALTLDRTVAMLAERVARRQPAYVSVCTVHTIVEALRDPSVKRAVKGAWICTPDGMPLVWWGKVSSPLPVGRVYGPDLMRSLIVDPRHDGTRHFFYGGTPEILEKLTSAARGLNPRVAIAGALAPPFSPLTREEEVETIERINASGADVVWVGLGCPKQDLWMARHREKLEPPVLVGVGAAFDFLSGTKAQAPYWMRRGGLEWSFRLATEPRRLWRRYLVTNSLFLLHAAAYVSGLGSYPLES